MSIQPTPLFIAPGRAWQYELWKNVVQVSMDLGASPHMAIKAGDIILAAVFERFGAVSANTEKAPV